MDIDLKQKDLLFLRSLAEYRLLTTRQASIIEGISERAVRNRANALCQSGLVELGYRAMGRGRGRPEYLIALKEKGMDYLRRETDSGLNASPDNVSDQDFACIEHHLLVNWFRVHLLHMTRIIPGLSADFYSPTTPYLPRRKDGKPLISDMVRIEDNNEWLIPDGVFALKSTERDKALLFFLEVDMSTESHTSLKEDRNDLANKIQKYLRYFETAGYKRYQKAFECTLNGFRLLFVANSSLRKESICRLIKDLPPLNFVWVTDQELMFKQGISAKIWMGGGRSDKEYQSIIGPSMAFEKPLSAVC